MDIPYSIPALCFGEYDHNNYWRNIYMICPEAFDAGAPFCIQVYTNYVADPACKGDYSWNDHFSAWCRITPNNTLAVLSTQYRLFHTSDWKWSGYNNEMRSKFHMLLTSMFLLPVIPAYTDVPFRYFRKHDLNSTTVAMLDLTTSPAAFSCRPENKDMLPTAYHTAYEAMKEFSVRYYDAKAMRALA